MMERITGFLIKNRNNSLEVKYLEKGRCITTENLGFVDPESLEVIRDNLLKTVVMNLGAARSWSEAKKVISVQKRLEIINMFEINVIQNKPNGKKDIEINFIQNGSFKVSSQFKDIDVRQIEKMREFLQENTEWNLRECDTQCRVIHYLDMLVILDQIENP